jgi:hypothetical protein
MYRTISLILLLMCIPVLVYAQEEGDDPSVEDDWEIYEMDLYTRGDQTFIISIGTVFPAVFLNNGKIIDHNFTPPVGGIGSLSYNYYLGSNIFLGAEFGFFFNSTLGRNVAYFIPLGVRGGYQFNVLRFEFPLAVTLGVIWHNYLNLGYFGMYVKGGGAAFYRYNANWSFGLTANWCWLPQWTREVRKNVDGNIVELMLSARYHF